MKKAEHLADAISSFDPMFTLDMEHKDWYVERKDDPLETMKVYLRSNRADTKVLFSGHVGSGKSSLLEKLANDPEITKQFLVVKFSLQDTLNLADLKYTDLLIAMGHRLYEAAESQLALDGSLLRDLDRWSAEITVTRARGEAAEVEAGAGIKAWFLRATGMLRSTFEKKEEFRLKFEPKIPQLMDFLNRIIAAAETSGGNAQREVLLIIDGLDKPDVATVMDLFYKKGPIVTQPRCKIVFTVPIALLYSGDYNLVKQYFSESFPLPNIKIKERSGKRNPEHCKTMMEVVWRRADRALINEDALDLAVQMSGGVVRELIRIMQGACTKALVAKKNSIAPQHVQETVAAIRAEYNYSLTREEDIEILRQVHKTGELRSQNNDRMLKLLHTLFILSYPDSPGWYAVNPIALDLIVPRGKARRAKRPTRRA